MNSYLYAMKTAFLFFPIIAILLTLPYVLSQYKKYGSLLVFRTAIIYSFILYLIVIYFLVILPLPPIEEVRNYTNDFVQLKPFYAITYLQQHIHFDITDFSTYSRLFGNAYFYQFIYNIFITIPFGIYLRYYFKCKFTKTLLLSFLLSLFFELTQLSGLYGIYPRPYRIFDVDDLITNTLGGVLGYFITPFFCFFLPSRDRMDEKAYKKGEKVSFSRRFVAFSIDFFIFSLLCLILYFCVRIYSKNISFFVPMGIGFGMYYLLLPILYNGYTIGRFLVKIQVVSKNDMPSKWYQLMIRECIFAFAYIYGVPILTKVKSLFESSKFSTLISVFLVFECILFLVSFFQILLKKEGMLIHEKLSRTKCVSTVIVPENEKMKD